MIEARYCVYLHKKKTTGEVYYVGSGVRHKREFHFSSRSKAWHNVHNEHGTDVEIYKENLTLNEARYLELKILESKLYPQLVNSRKVTYPFVYDLDALNELLAYDERFITCLTFKVRTGPRALVGGQAGSVVFDHQGRPRRTSVKVLDKVTACSRIIWMLHNGHIPENSIIDHVDGNPHNNKIKNLRCISISENSMNRRKSSKSDLPSGIYVHSNSFLVNAVNNDKRQSASFSISLYGYSSALEMAKAWRVNKLNEFGVLDQYSERHLGFNPTQYLGYKVERNPMFSAAGENIWVKRNKLGEITSLSAGLTRINRRYVNVTASRTYEQALTICNEYLELLKSTSVAGDDSSVGNLENA